MALDARPTSSAPARVRSLKRAPLLRPALVPLAHARPKEKRSEHDEENDGSVGRATRRAVLVARLFAASGAALSRANARASEQTGVDSSMDALPRAYASKARTLVEAMSKSLERDGARAGASASERYEYASDAKKAIKAYIAYDVEGDGDVVKSSEAYANIALALREVSAFYKANGATAEMSSATRDGILAKLYAARDALPKREETIVDRLFARAP